MLSSLLNPKSIAVVGVSLDPEKVGHQIFVNLSSFKGSVYPIHPKHRRILGKIAFSSLLSVPERLDLVIIATPMPTVEGIIDECIDAHVRCVIIVSAGFAETGSQGALIQSRIIKKLSIHGILLLGPNSLGAVCPKQKLNASFAPHLIDGGNVAVISQSGAMLSTVFSKFASRRVGCSFALSLGNKGGISELEALEYALNDEDSKVVALYLESITNVPKFLALCRKVSKLKPIIFLKGGTTPEGNRASLSHTAALATDAVLLKEASIQMGFAMVATIEQFIEVSIFVDKFIKKFPLGKIHRNLLVISNAGGMAVNATDVAIDAGLKIAQLGEGSAGKLARELPRVAPHNPLDLLGDAQARDIQIALEIAQEDESVECILVIITQQAVTDIAQIVRMLTTMGTKKLEKPVIISLMGGDNLQKDVISLRRHGFSVVTYANEGVEIFSWLHRLGQASKVDRSQSLMQEIELALSKSEPSRVRERRQSPLTSGSLEETYLMLEKYSFCLPRCAIAKDEADIEEMGKLDPLKVFPLIAKTANMKLKHKALVGGVIKDIHNIKDAQAAYRHLKKFSNRVLFQELIVGAREVIIGGSRDPQFGSFLAIGLGGSLTNIISDRAYIFLPASLREMRLALGRTKLISTLSASQISLCLQALDRFSRIFADHPEIRELEINPLMITDDKMYVADVKIDQR